MQIPQYFQYRKCLCLATSWNYLDEDINLFLPNQFPNCLPISSILFPFPSPFQFPNRNKVLLNNTILQIWWILLLSLNKIGIKNKWFITWVINLIPLGLVFILGKPVVEIALSVNTFIIMYESLVRLKAHHDWSVCSYFVHHVKFIWHAIRPSNISCDYISTFGRMLWRNASDRTLDYFGIDFYKLIFRFIK